MKRLEETWVRQAARPHGLLGQFYALLMRRFASPLNHWMVDLLEVTSHDRILEVGFGPGVALAQLLARASDGFVAGVDVSELMVRQAQSRHADAIAAGQLEVRQGDASCLPYDDATFDKVCGALVIYFWPDTLATVRELRRVLRPRGTLALAYLEGESVPRSAASGLTRIGAKLFGPGEVEAVARAAGFETVRLETKGAPERPDGFCLVAVK